MAIIQGNYTPDDSGITTAAMHYLLTPAGAELRAAARGAEAAGISRLEQLRKAYPLEAVHAALVMARLQEKATAKFPQVEDAKLSARRAESGAFRWFWATPEALEQASSLAVARHKAQRMGMLLAEAKGTILDLCAGIGGDALGLADAGPVVAAELSAVRALCAMENVRARPGRYPVAVVRTDVTTLPFAITTKRSGAALFHLDPARRTGGKRSHDYADLLPPPAFIQRVVEQFPAGGAIKLSPGVDFATLPAGHVEVISEHGTAVQAVLWTGRLGETLGGSTVRTATLVATHQPSGVAVPWSLTGVPEGPGGRPTVEPREYLYEVDAAVHRAGLAGVLANRLSLEAANTDGGYLTGGALVAEPALRAFRHLATMAYSEKRVATALRGAGTVVPAGPVEVKTRGGLGLPTDALQRAWSKVTDRAVTVLVYRTAGGVRATLAVREERISGTRF